MNTIVNKKYDIMKFDLQRFQSPLLLMRLYSNNFHFPFLCIIKGMKMIRLVYF